MNGLSSRVLPTGPAAQFPQMRVVLTGRPTEAAGREGGCHVRADGRATPATLETEVRGTRTRHEATRAAAETQHATLAVALGGHAFGDRSGQPVPRPWRLRGLWSYRLKRQPPPCGT